MSYPDLPFFLRPVQSLLSDPNPASPANAEASQLYERDRREYNKRVRAVVEASWIDDDNDGAEYEVSSSSSSSSAVAGGVDAAPAAATAAAAAAAAAAAGGGVAGAALSSGSAGVSAPVGTVFGHVEAAAAAAAAPG